jgi:hypothetical protein
MTISGKLLSRDKARRSAAVNIAMLPELLNKPA